jgi:3'-phosphoadenosine 5'-phosphosulfate sulfotransferase (PAPS reductase)/FAD synthetase
VIPDLSEYDRIVVHCDLDEEEWPGTRELAAEHAAHYGLRFEVVKRTGGQGRSLLQEIEHRGKWPSSVTRYCTSYYKREPALKLLTQLTRELLAARSHGVRTVRTGRSHGANPVRILNCYGFRAEESPRRRKLPAFQVNRRATARTVRLVEDWLPIQDWTTDEVWARNRQAGTRHHYAYDLGMKRLSCRFCIFAPKGQLMIAARHNPELFEKYVAVEERIGHRFRVELSLVEVRDALASGEAPPADDGTWNM